MKTIQPKLFLSLSLLALASSSRAAAPAAPRYRQVAVATGHEAASRAAVEVLREGGDAVDGAVAALASLGVCTPQSSGLGGGFFALVYRADERRTYVLDAREVAPARAHAHMYKEGGREDGEPTPEKARWGGLAVAVPGEVRGYQALHERWGKLPWPALLAPATRLAREGSRVNGYLAYVAEKVARRFQRSPQARDLYQPGGVVPELGSLWRNPDLATTLETLAEEGPDWFYTGDLARELVDQVQAEGGILDRNDLGAYRVRWREPLTREFRGHQVVAMPPPSSGGVLLHQALGILDHFPLDQMGWNSSAYLHTLAEALKVAFADRATWLADPDHHEVPVDELLDPERLERLARGVHPHHVRELEGYRIGLGDDAGTAHVSVVDAAGNVVAATSTINYGYGSLVVVPGRGFVLNNEMDDFSLDPGVPNLFGLIQSERNAVAPGKRPLSSMAPTLVLREGRPVLALGGSGGPRIPSATLQTMLNVLVFGMDLQEAVQVPRIHHQWRPDVLRIEAGLPRDVRVALQRRGQRVVEYDRFGGRVQAVQIGEGFLRAASDPRKEGRPSGY